MVSAASAKLREGWPKRLPVNTSFPGWLVQNLQGTPDTLCLDMNRGPSHLADLNMAQGLGPSEGQAAQPTPPCAKIYIGRIMSL